MIITVLLTLVGYKVVMETLTRGKTLGKMMLGLKVVRDDGSSIRFRHALVRALLWLFVDFAPWFAASPGIVASLMNKQGKRIGDMVAGTVVIRERHQPMASPPLFVPGHLVQWAQSLELSRLSDDLANTAREYLARFIELEPAARVALGDELAYRVGQVTAPAPPVPIIVARVPVRSTGRTPPPRTDPPSHRQGDVQRQHRPLHPPHAVRRSARPLRHPRPVRRPGRPFRRTRSGRHLRATRPDRSG